MERDATIFEKFLVSLTKVLLLLDFLIKLEPTGRFNQKIKYMRMFLVIVTKVLSLYYVFTLSFNSKDNGWNEFDARSIWPTLN